MLGSSFGFRPPRDRGYDTVYRERGARLLRRRPGGEAHATVLLVPSLINRWYVLDLRPQVSVVEALANRGFDVYLLDWGVAGDEARYTSWDDVVRMLRRAVARVRRRAVGKLGVLGYCMGGTLTTISTALDPERVDALVALAAPIDFSSAGMLGHLVDKRWFDPDAIADAGNVPGWQMQAGFMALRPTAPLGKVIKLVDSLGDPDKWDAFLTLEAWASDNVPFPGEAYRRYIGELYQDNALARGIHRADGEAVDLGRIECPVLAISATADAICPPAAVNALEGLCSRADVDTLSIPGGHVGAVVGHRAQTVLFPRLGDWFKEQLCN